MKSHDNRMNCEFVCGDDAHIVPCRVGVFPCPVEWGNVVLLSHYPVSFNVQR